MSGDEFQKELSSLKQQIVRDNDTERTDAPTATAAPQEPSDLEKQLKALSDALSEAATGAEGSIKQYPFTAVVAALLLGVLIGRLTGRE